jgi:isopentenyl-diphosphate delta-isomerase type 1
MLTEIFQLVDRAGTPIGQATRAECHGNPSLMHLVVHIHIISSDGRLLLQKRSARKDTNPGLWDTSVGGHVNAGEPVREAVLRESREELGIDASEARPLYTLLNEGSYESEFAHCYLLTCGGPFHADPEEIDEVRFFSVQQVEEMIGTGSLTPLFEREWPRLREAMREWQLLRDGGGRQSNFR